MSAEKRKFIQTAIIQLAANHPSFQAKPDPSLLVKAAEKLWQITESAGYGAATKKDPKPHKGKNWYQELTEASQLKFCRFWEAFNYKHGRNEAAQSWALLGETKDGKYLGPDDELAKIITEAAKQEALRELPTGTSRMMGQGWLSKRRWEDSVKTPKSNECKAAENKSALITEAQEEVAHWKRMFDSQGTEEAKKLLNAAKEKLASLTA
ncbi:MAG: hypothetical protein ACPH15_06095 [Pseudomonadales bacterium]